MAKGKYPESAETGITRMLARTHSGRAMPRRALRILIGGLAAGLVTLVVAQDGKKPTSYMPVVVQEDFGSVMKRMSAAKAGRALTLTGLIMDRFEAGRWYHIAFSYDGKRTSEGFRMFVNGKPAQAQGSGKSGRLNGEIRTFAPFRIGKKTAAKPQGRSRPGSMCTRIKTFLACALPLQIVTVWASPSLISTGPAVAFQSI